MCHGACWGCVCATSAPLHVRLVIVSAAAADHTLGALIQRCLVCVTAMQVSKGYHKQLRKFVAVKRVNITNKVGWEAGCAGVTL